MASVAPKAQRDRLLKLLARGPRRPSDLSRRDRLRAFGRTLYELLGDDLTDRAAALTYYAVLAVFPGLLVLVAGVGLLGPPATRSVVEGIGTMTFGPTQQIIANGVADLQDNPREAGVIAIVGLVIAFWSATGYVGAFMRAANAIFEVPEARPLWKTLPVRLFITVVTGLVLALSAFAIVFTGRLAVQIGHAVGIDADRVRLIDIVKWPVLVVVFALLLAVLYWAAPNARHGGFRWITPGSLLATLVWLLVSGGFAFYVSRFDSFDRNYGTLGGVIVFLVWIWLTNVAVLLGAEFDAELARARAIAAGLPDDETPYLPLRDVPKG
ncbi:YihY/virulence factor BrkB family protein [Allorhizocola rhizosphaerae]|uniref:YihY/virulence factor BrkB family protein n=1 Tax=Allorhizocola rhizosphaerae TaxID=1872709 RepID=UPI000E3E90AC|nr:YihY/virulence factor BrkB family protein [Allorhizocola rhizosphaerae]